MVAAAATTLVTPVAKDHVVLTAVVALLAFLIAASHLAQGKETPGYKSGIPPVVWEVVATSGADGKRVVVSNPKRYTVQFQPGGRLAVASGCNHLAGTYKAKHGTLEVRIFNSAISPCSAASKSEEEPVLGLLDAVTRYEFDPDGYLVLAGDDERLWLRARLTGVVCEWQSFPGGGDSHVESEIPENYTLTFVPGGTLAIRAGCSQATGTCATDGATIELLVGHITGGTCPQQSKSDQFLRDLGEVTSHVVRDGNLYLALWADAGIMEFAARCPESPPATPRVG